MLILGIELWHLAINKNRRQWIQMALSCFLADDTIAVLECGFLFQMEKFETSLECLDQVLIWRDLSQSILSGNDDELSEITNKYLWAYLGCGSLDIDSGFEDIAHQLQLIQNTPFCFTINIIVKDDRFLEVALPIRSANVLEVDVTELVMGVVVLLGQFYCHCRFATAWVTIQPNSSDLLDHLCWRLENCLQLLLVLCHHWGLLE